MKKRAFLFLFATVLFFSFTLGGKTAFAQSKAVLESQYFDGSVLYYVYKLPTGKEYIKTFPVDERTKQKAKQSKNSTQVVKNELIAAYTILGLEDRLEELEGTFIYGIEGLGFEVKSSLKDTFSSELKEAKRYAKEQVTSFSSLSEKEKHSYYDTKQSMYQSYKELNKSIKVDTTFNEAQKEKAKEQEKEAEAHSNTWTIVLGAVFVVGLLSFVVYALKRGR